MAEREASSTAWGVMILRAVHQLIDEEPRILDDPVAVRLIDAATRADILSRGETARTQSGEFAALRGHVVVRSRYAEDRLAEAIERGVRQLVVLGAGYDTFAYRQPDWAHQLSIFEVDHPATQEAKRQHLTAAGVAIPANVRFAAIDFEQETLAGGLEHAGFDPAVPTFISCLGVLVYLTREAVIGIFDFARSLAAESEIVCTFRSKREARRSDLAAAVAAMGEPWLSEFDPFALEAELRAMGFGEVTLVSGAELEVRYALRRRDGVRPPAKMMMLSAIV